MKNHLFNCARTIRIVLIFCGLAFASQSMTYAETLPLTVAVFGAQGCTLNYPPMPDAANADVVFNKENTDRGWYYNGSGPFAEFATYITLNVNSSITAKAKDGYNFKGWYSLPKENDNFTDVTLSDLSATPLTTNYAISCADIKSKAGKYHVASEIKYVVFAKYVPVYEISVLASPKEAGEVTGGGKHEENSQVTLKVTKENLGWKFDHWENAKKDNLGTNKEYEVTITNRETYTAVFQSTAVEVSLEKLGGTGGTDSITVTNSLAMPAITIPTKTGHNFNGYWTEQNGQGTQYYTSKGKSARNWNETEVFALYAAWTPYTYTVRFADQGADLKSGQGSLAVTYGSNPGSVQIPAKSFNTFDGYYYNTTKLWDFLGNWCGGIWNIIDGESGSTIEVAAKWNPESFTIHFDLNGGSGTVADLNNIPYDQKFALPSGSGFSKVGFAFSGWALSEQGAKFYDGGVETSVEANKSAAQTGPNRLTFYAVWQDRSRQVNFKVDSKEASVEPESKTVEMGKAFGELAVAKWDGDRRSLSGWWDSSVGGSEVTAETIVPEGTGAINLYARWTTNSYFVAFDGNGNTDGKMPRQEFRFDTPQALNKNTFKRTGYTFLGWTTNEVDKIFNDGATITKNLASTKDAEVTLKALWETNRYTIVFFGNGGTNGVPFYTQACAYDSEVKLTPNRFLRDGFEFIGWALDPTNEVAFVNGGEAKNLTATPNGQVYLFAKWKQTGSEELSELSRAIDSNVNLTTNVVGWTIESEPSSTCGTVLKSGIDPETSTADERLMQCRLSGKGRLTFRYKTQIESNPNGGPSVFSFMVNQNEEKVCVSDVAEWTEYAYQKEGGDEEILSWLLKLWNENHQFHSDDSSCGSDDDYVLIESIKWEPAETNAQMVGVTFRTNDGTEAPADIVTNISLAAGEAIGELPELPNNMYRTFRGWGKTLDALEPISSDWLVPIDAEGTQIYALWEQLPIITNSVPIAEAGLVYDGTEKIGVAAGENYTIVGNVATNAGKYTATATLNWGCVWEGGFDEPTNIVWTIAKATYDLSGITFTNETYEADGSAKSILISGELPVGVTVAYEGNGMTDPGEYTVTAKFTGDTTNYELISDKTATLTIVKKEDPPTPPDPPPLVVTNEVPIAIADLTYDGTEKIGVAAGENYTIVGNVATNAGIYEAIATVTNGVWEGGFDGPTNIVWTIAKATYDLSGITFTNGTYEADGSAKSILISGELPAGVTVAYEGNGQTEPGEYTVTAKFTGDATNYELIPDKTAKLTITKKEDPPTPPDPPTPTDPTVAYENIHYKATLAELGAEAVPTNHKITIKAEGLPKGLKLVTVALKDDKNRTTGFFAYTIEGVPTELMDGTNRVAYVRVTDNKVQTLYALELKVRSAAEYEMKSFPDGKVNFAYTNFSVTNLWPDVAVHPKNWTFSGWPSGIKFSTKSVTARQKIDGVYVTVTNAQPYEVYGMPTKAGRFTIKAMEKIDGTSYKSTHVATLTIWPMSSSQDEEMVDQAYVGVYRATENDVKSASGLPTGIKFTARDIISRGEVTTEAYHFYGTPTKSGTFAVTLTHKDGGKSQFLWTITPADPPAFELKLTETKVDSLTAKATIRQGVQYDWKIECTFNSTVTASGLPTGMKLVKTAVKDGTKTIGYTYSVSGVPTKAGEFFVTFTTKLNGVSQITTAAFVVLDLPAWAQGTFDGGADEDAFAVGGQVTLTISKVGKLSGKWMSEGTNWTLSAMAYNRYDDTAESYVATMVGKTGSGKNARTFTNELYVTADEVGGVATNELFLAYQNNWKLEPWRTHGKTIAKAVTYEFHPYADVGDEHTNDTISLKFSTSGKVTVKANYFKSVSKTGKISWTTVSGSATLCPQSMPEDNAFPAAVFVYFPPKKGTPTASSTYTSCVRLWWNGSTFVEWIEPE